AASRQDVDDCLNGSQQKIDLSIQTIVKTLTDDAWTHGSQYAPNVDVICVNRLLGEHLTYVDPIGKSFVVYQQRQLAKLQDAADQTDFTNQTAAQNLLHLCNSLEQKIELDSDTMQRIFEDLFNKYAKDYAACFPSNLASADMSNSV
ncbi:unnamed protein product, partial [Nesidiocoris tenuis]